MDRRIQRDRHRPQFPDREQGRARRMPAQERRVDAASQNGRSPPATPAPSRNPGVREPPTPPLSSPGRAGHEYPEMPRSAGPRRMLVAVPSPSFPAGVAANRGGWSPIRGHDNAPPPSSIEREWQGPRAVWATPIRIVVCSKRFTDTSRKIARHLNRRTLTNPATETQGTGPRASHQLCQDPVQVAVKLL